MQVTRFQLLGRQPNLRFGQSSNRRLAEQVVQTETEYRQRKQDQQANTQGQTLGKSRCSIPLAQFCLPLWS